jgi:hypothetical protein
VGTVENQKNLKKNIDENRKNLYLSLKTARCFGTLFLVFTVYIFLRGEDKRYGKAIEIQ